MNGAIPIAAESLILLLVMITSLRPDPIVNGWMVVDNGWIWLAEWTAFGRRSYHDGSAEYYYINLWMKRGVNGLRRLNTENRTVLQHLL